MKGQTHGGKGSTYRSVDRAKFNKGYDSINWSKKREKEKMMLEDYVSPEHEQSYFKGIPIEHRYHQEVRSLLMTGEFKVRYRGPRSDSFALTCLKEDAKTFAIYRK